MCMKNGVYLNSLALTALLVLKEKESVSETAIFLNITQSSVSKLLSALKLEFNDNLYTKTNNGFIFTKIGESLCSIYRNFLEPGMEMIERIKIHKEREFSIFLPQWADITKIRGDLLKKYPHTNCKLSFQLDINLSTNYICESLMNGFIDVCICHFPDYKSGILKKELCFTELIFLSKNKSHIEFNDLNSCNFVKYNINNNLFNSFMFSNNIGFPIISEEIYGTDQWLDGIDSNKIIITTDYYARDLLNRGYTSLDVNIDIITTFPLHLIWHSKYKYDEYLNELCNIITKSII